MGFCAGMEQSMQSPYLAPAPVWSLVRIVMQRLYVAEIEAFLLTSVQIYFSELSTFDASSVEMV